MDSFSTYSTLVTSILAGMTDFTFSDNNALLVYDENQEKLVKKIETSSSLVEWTNQLRVKISEEYLFL